MSQYWLYYKPLAAIVDYLATFPLHCSTSDHKDLALCLLPGNVPL